jgi:hypothetical protein
MFWIKLKSECRGVLNMMKPSVVQKTLDISAVGDEGTLPPLQTGFDYLSSTSNFSYDRGRLWSKV